MPPSDPASSMPRWLMKVSPVATCQCSSPGGATTVRARCWWRRRQFDQACGQAGTRRGVMTRTVNNRRISLQDSCGVPEIGLSL
jgi:hypothetical protein